MASKTHEIFWEGYPDSGVNIFYYAWWGLLLLLAITFLVILPKLPPLFAILETGFFILCFLVILEKSRAAVRSYQLTGSGVRFVSARGANVLIPYQDIKRVVVYCKLADRVRKTRTFWLDIPFATREKNMLSRGPGHWRLLHVRDHESVADLLREHVPVNIRA